MRHSEGLLVTLGENVDWRLQHDQSYCDHVQSTYDLVAFEDQDQVWDHSY